ncbi:winged helix-turn-helix domain-containing protein [Streptomyces fumanus]|uniref:winged helix-turn-helix domain-containing protein n=1 Tax=Streptomyces fumanus TaxID=67302 RepID=UPI0033C510FB
MGDQRWTLERIAALTGARCQATYTPTGVSRLLDPATRRNRALWKGTTASTTSKPPSATARSRSSTVLTRSRTLRRDRTDLHSDVIKPATPRVPAE